MKSPRVRKVQKPTFPQFGRGKKTNEFISLLQFVAGVIVWALLILFFLISVYAQWFGAQLTYILTLIKPKSYYVPFWFSFVCSVVFFPITLAVGIIAALIKIIRE